MNRPSIQTPPAFPLDPAVDIGLTGRVGQQQPHTELHRIVERAGAGVDDARVALRDGPVRVRLRAAIRALAVHRGSQRSTCPSDAARAVGGEGWRELMGDARDLARELALAGEVEITQRGTVLDPRDEWSGPVRIRTPGH